MLSPRPTPATAAALAAPLYVPGVGRLSKRGGRLGVGAVAHVLSSPAHADFLVF